MSERIIKLGWEEWLSLPDLTLPAIKAKIDTGARTSALHATGITAQDDQLHFTLHPIPDAPEVTIKAQAPIKDRREVTSSNGERELRYVIETNLQFGDQSWPIEVTLTDRTGMAYHMLLGRMALVDHCVVVPGESHQQPDLSYAVYKRNRSKKRAPRNLKIALLTTKPGSKNAKTLHQKALDSGHMLTPLDPATLTIRTGAKPQILQHGQPLPPPDAVLSDLPATRFNAALLRQFRQLGSYTPNTAEGITSALDPLRASQILSQAHFATPDLTHTAQTKAQPPQDGGPQALIIGTKLTMLTPGVKLTKEERKTLRRAARLFKLALVQISFRRADTGLEITALNPRPQLHTRPKRIDALLTLLEKKSRPKLTRY